MKAVFIVYNHGITEEVEDILKKFEIKGFTRWLGVHGQGSNKGEPHLGSHIWPSVNAAILTVINDEKVDPLLKEIEEVNKKVEEQGLHSFVFNVEKMV